MQAFNKYDKIPLMKGFCLKNGILSILMADMKL
jgi:hypothetical protein